MTSKGFYAIIAGVGAGTGGALAKRFAQSYPVVLLARKPDSYSALVSEINSSGGKAVGVSADTGDSASMQSAFETIKKDMAGSKLAAAVYNVGGTLVRKPFLDMKIADLDASLGANPRGFFNFAQGTLPLLLESVDSSPHPPSLLVTGATASLKGGIGFSGFAAGKFAKRAIVQSIAREFGPKGIHVAHVIVDGIILTPKTAQMGVEKFGGEEGMLSPEAIAETYWYLHTQPKSTFTQELDIRPFKEAF